MIGRPLLHRCLDLGSLVSWAVWYGGLTFYSSVVVAIGTEQLGATDQGFITQEVTSWLNALGLLAMVLCGLRLVAMRASTARTKSTWQFSVIVANIVILLALIWIHARLTAQLDFDTRTPPGRTFYQWHRAYLIGTTIQWLLGLLMAFDFARTIKSFPRQELTS